MRTLYEITSDYMALLEMMEDQEIPEDVISDTMEGIQGELEVKADSYITIIKRLETDNEGDQKEIDRLSKRVKARSANIDRLKTSLSAAMKSTGKTKLPTEHYKLSICKNGGVAPLVYKGDVPAEFCRLEPDTSKIREALKTGALDFAELGERGEHLRIS